MSADDLKSAQRASAMFRSERAINAILELSDPRPGASKVPEVNDQLAWGPGPRASQALMLAVRAWAVIDGRLAPSVDDVTPWRAHSSSPNTQAARAEGVTGNIIDLMAAESQARWKVHEIAMTAKYSNYMSRFRQRMP